MTDRTRFAERYSDRFGPTWTFDRSEEGILLVTYNDPAVRAAGSVADPSALESGGTSLPTSEGLWTQIAQDEENRVVVLTGHGDVFSDTWEPSRPRGFYNATMWGQVLYALPRSLNAFLDIPTLIIGAANGAATVHAEYLLLCDIVIAAEDATFGDKPHFRNGHVPGDGVNIVWPLLLGWNRGREFLLTGRDIGAREAVDLGLIKEVVPREKLLPRCHEVAAELLRVDRNARRFTAMALRQQLKTMINLFLPHSLALEGISFIEQSQQGPE
jgi:enoyl-CoA hydratase/carnithine racemase